MIDNEFSIVLTNFGIVTDSNLSQFENGLIPIKSTKDWFENITNFNFLQQ